LATKVQILSQTTKTKPNIYVGIRTKKIDCLATINLY